MASILTRNLLTRFPTSWINGVGLKDLQTRRFVRKLANLLRQGQTVVLREKLYSVLKFTHRQGTARQGGHVQLELREIRTQLKSTERLRSSEEIEVAFLKSENYEVLYTTSEGEVNLIDPQSYDQITVPTSIFTDQKDYLSSGMPVVIESYEGDPVIGSLPVIVELKIKEVSIEISDGLRQAELENGHKMKVPAFVGSGDWIAINSNDHQFVKRVSKASQN